jgi:peroxiredoxin family protein
MDENAGGAGAQKATIVVFSGELDRALACFNIANTAAAMGTEVTMFFTFWGLNVVRKNSALSRPKDLARRILGWMNPGGAARLKLSKLHMFGLGTGMMKGLMKQERMPSLDELIAIASSLGVHFVACTTSMNLMGVTEDDFIPEVKEFAGAATYLGAAQQGRVNLFI